jgi:hypothetical protein
VRLKEFALERRRFGYRRPHIPLRREGFELNHKKLFRLYREQLTLKKRGGCKLRRRTPGIPWLASRYPPPRLAETLDPVMPTWTNERPLGEGEVYLALNGNEVLEQARQARTPSVAAANTT